MPRGDQRKHPGRGEKPGRASQRRRHLNEASEAVRGPGPQSSFGADPTSPSLSHARWHQERLFLSWDIGVENTLKRT